MRCSAAVMHHDDWSRVGCKLVRVLSITDVTRPAPRSAADKVARPATTCHAIRSSIHQLANMTHSTLTESDTLLAWSLVLVIESFCTGDHSCCCSHREDVDVSQHLRFGANGSSRQLFDRQGRFLWPICASRLSLCHDLMPLPVF